MQKSIIIIAFLASFNPLFAQEQRLLELTEQYGIPGIQLVCIKGNKQESYNLGTISQGSDKRVTGNTIFEAASLSKCVFAYSVLRLCDRGVINLDTPMVRYIGAYERFDPADPRYAKITARMVLRHTTGLPNWGDNKVARLIFTPDSTFSYSGEGFQYLQRVVEKLTNKTLNEIAQQEVFTPLGMPHSSYTWTDKFDTLAAFGNSPDAVNGHKSQRAAASLLTCAHDYAIFLRALMAGTGLKSETHRMMFEKQSAGNWFRHKVKEANKHIWWGLGIGLQENETGEWIWQWGDNGDFKGFCIANPKKNEALVYFTYSTWGLHITTDILNAFFPGQTWWPDLWIGYQFDERGYMQSFWTQLEKQGYDHAAEIARDLKRQDSSFKLPEADVNDLGFILLRKGMKKEAIKIFNYNVSANPSSANAYESLAEGYDDIGEKEFAIKNFSRSVELNPQNSFAADRIKKLEGETNIRSWGQEPVFRIKFSEPLAVFEFVNNLSVTAGNNPFKKLFDSSRFDRGKYKALLAEYDSLNIDYSYEFTSYPYAQKIGGATKSLLKRNLLNAQTFAEFKLSSLGIIPNCDLFTLDSILTAFDPVYQELVYQPNKDRFEQQLRELSNLVASRNVTAYFDVGLRFFHSSWDNAIPFEMAFYPLPDSKGFTATAFYNNTESGIPTSLKDYNKLLSVMLHEIFHILYDEQSLLLKQNIQKWFTSDTSINSRYAYLLLNESLATALGNGYVYGKLNGGEDTSYWYRRKYTNLMAKKIYPLVSEYILQQKPIDKSFVENYIKIYDDNFSVWLTEIDNIMTDRYVVSDKPADFEIIDELFPYRSMSQYERDVSESSIEKMKQAPITKVVIISKDNSNQLRLVKQNFSELKSWTPNVQADFSHSVFLADKTYLIIINVVRKSPKEQLEGLKVSPR